MMKTLLRNQEIKGKFFELIAEKSGIVTWRYDPHYFTIYIDDFDYCSANEVLHMGKIIEDVPYSILDYIDKDSREAFLELYDDIFEGKEMTSRVLWLNKELVGERICKRVTYYTVLDMDGNPSMSYGFSVNITSEIKKNFKLNNILTSMDINPSSMLKYCLNLTKNECEEGHFSNKYLEDNIKTTSVTEFLESIRNMIYYKDETEVAKRVLCEEYLLRKFESGQTEVLFNFHIENANKMIRWVTIFINLQRKVFNDEVSAYIYIEDTNDKKITDNILKHISNEAFDYVAILDCVSSTLEYKIKSKDFEEVVKEDVLQGEDINKCLEYFEPVSEDAIRVKKEISVEKVTEHLNKFGKYLFTFTIIKDGQLFKKQIQYSYLDKKRNILLIIGSDITSAFIEEKKHEEELKNALSQAKKATQMKTDFISNVSHDMRTPLNGIIGYTQLALEEENPDVLKDYIVKIKRSGENLLRLINDTLDFSKIERGTEDFKPVDADLKEVLDGIINTIMPQMESKNIEFVFEHNEKFEENCVILDVLRFEKIILNVLSNSVKFTEDGGKIIFRFFYEKERDMLKSHIEIIDNGVGISKEFLPNIFEPYTQERTGKTATIGGSGLGLSIVKKLVQLQKGSIKVESKLEKGTKFTIEYPMKISSKTIEAHKESKVDNRVKILFGKRILLCEDNPINAEIATIMLKKNGMHVTSANNGKEGVEILENSKEGYYDLVLMDLRMPVMNGFEATKAIRYFKRKDIKNIPIIAMTADAYDKDVEKCIKAGMNDHLGKPIDINKLLEKLKKHL
ncbi:Signal transduction histidine kinase [Acetitomaculum ruminis DSM 5522]|uniref:Stage 0 sporulation protein A homolog n=1 Tax=Acetitomaculum ruminis DSM 5522 TaxID=1120918 RepID=A0A1I0YKF6_9FIRM|nr:response regulator [Acetitomaculum ruminis]SFB12798.1 Signal transduction histidine kinase [Acetitomaculum ruminis DSM 5522]